MAMALSPVAMPVEHLSVRVLKRYHSVGRDFTLDVDVHLPPGITIIFGPSGSGKTTLLDCVAGLAVPDAGLIQLHDRVFFDSNKGSSLAVQSRHVGYVFQDLALFPHLTATQNIQFGLASLAPDVKRTRSDEILESFRISHLCDRKPGQISGGERQRVALARALVTDPCLLLLDEPLAALDGPTKSHLIDDLREWNRTRSIPILYVTHGREEVFALGENVVVLQEGRVIAHGTPHEVMAAPRQETVAQLAGFENVFDVIVQAIHEDGGTMTCRISETMVELETPLVFAGVGSVFKVGIRAGDILLSTVLPVGLSARNIIPGRIVSLVQRDMIVVVRVNCGVEMEIHLTLAARAALALQPGQEIWLVLKTHSCHLMAV
jgi:molybdate transport system ATP-binding protein